MPEPELLALSLRGPALVSMPDSSQYSKLAGAVAGDLPVAEYSEAKWTFRSSSENPAIVLHCTPEGVEMLNKDSRSFSASVCRVLAIWNNVSPLLDLQNRSAALMIFTYFSIEGESPLLAKRPGGVSDLLPGYSAVFTAMMPEGTMEPPYVGIGSIMGMSFLLLGSFRQRVSSDGVKTELESIAAKFTDERIDALCRGTRANE